MSKLTVFNLVSIYRTGYGRTRLRYGRLGLHLTLCTLFMLLIGCVGSLTPLLLSHVVDSLGGYVRGQYILVLALVYGICWAVGNVAEWTKGVVSAYVLVKCEVAIALEIISGIVYKPHLEQSGLDAGVVVTDLNRAMRSFGAINDSLLWVLLPTVFQLIFSFFIILNEISMSMAILFIFSMAFLFLMACWVSMRSESVYRKIFSAQNEISSFISEYVSKMYEIKINNFEKHVELKAFQKLNDYRVDVFGANFLAGMLLGFQALLVGCAVIFFSVYAALRINSGELAVGGFVLITGYAIQMTLPFAIIASSLMNLKSHFIALDNSLKYMSEFDRDFFGKTDENIKDIANLLSGDSVIFCFVDVFLLGRCGGCSPLNWVLEAGKVYVITGQSGLGKTTLIKTMIGLIPMSSGYIYFRGRKVDHKFKYELLEEVAVVSQDVCLFGGDLRDNLTFGGMFHRDSAAVDDVIDRLHLSALDLKCRALSDLSGVSGGERQRIGIGRSLLRGMQIMILDEPTSALDFELEASILLYLKSKVQTLIIVTHRKAPIALADVVYSL